MKRKLFPSGNGAMDTMEHHPQATNAQKPFQSFDNNSSRSRSQPKATLHKRSNTMFGYTRYSQNTEHFEKSLHTNESYINIPMFATCLKPLRGKQSTTPTK